MSKILKTIFKKFVGGGFELCTSYRCISKQVSWELIIFIMWKDKIDWLVRLSAW